MTNTATQAPAHTLPAQKTITLRVPVKLGDGPDAVVYDAIELCEPSAKDLEYARAMANDANGNGVTFNVALISTVASIPIGAARMLKQRDYQDCVMYLGAFTLAAQLTGGA